MQSPANGQCLPVRDTKCADNDTGKSVRNQTLRVQKPFRFIAVSSRDRCSGSCDGNSVPNLPNVMAHPVQSSRAFAHATASAIRFVSEADMCSAQAHVCFGSKADSCSAATHVRFTPNSDRESGHPQEFMSALPPKADMCKMPCPLRANSGH